MAGGPAAGAGRVRLRERLLLLHIDTVSCCSLGAPMGAACRPPQPWTYRSVAGEFAYLERSFVAELGPPRLLAEPSVPPHAWRQQDPPRGCQPWPQSLPWGAAPPQPAAAGRPGPPSYEAHMLRMAQARRPGPPPYVSPPAYDGPHRTLRPAALRRPPPARCSHTLPRAATEARSRRPPPRWERSQTLPRAAPPRGRQGPRKAPGGHFVIDATRVRVRAEYVPPPRREQVRYVGGGPAGPAPAPSPRPQPAGTAGTAPAGAVPSPLGSPGQRGGAPGSPGQREVPGSPRQRRGAGSPGQRAVPEAPGPWRLSGSPRHHGVPRSPGHQGSPGFPRHPGVSRSPGPWRAAGSPRHQEVPGSPDRWVSPGSPVSRGVPVSPRRPPYARRPALYAQDLREAVSRIRRHTAPDSDSEAEAPRSAGSCRRCRDTRAWSSSSSSSLEGAGATACA